MNPIEDFVLILIGPNCRYVKNIFLRICRLLKCRPGLVTYEFEGETQFKHLLKYSGNNSRLLRIMCSYLDNGRPAQYELQSGVRRVDATDAEYGEPRQLVADCGHRTQPHRSRRISRYATVRRVLLATWLITFSSLWMEILGT